MVDHLLQRDVLLHPSPHVAHAGPLDGQLLLAENHREPRAQPVGLLHLRAQTAVGGFPDGPQAGGADTVQQPKSRLTSSKWGRQASSRYSVIRGAPAAILWQPGSLHSRIRRGFTSNRRWQSSPSWSRYGRK